MAWKYETQGTLLGLKPRQDNPVQYELVLDSGPIPLNSLLECPIQINFHGTIRCIYCHKTTSRSFNRGSCYTCFRNLAANDLCIVKPETCHFHNGTCREPDWGRAKCFIPHTVYLANTTGIKVGITRSYRLVDRWMEQGAAQGLALGEVPDRLSAGRIEIHLARQMADKTNWRRLLLQAAPGVDLLSAASRLREALGAQLSPHSSHEGEYRFTYPVIQYPRKINSVNLERQPRLRGILMGIKGRYLLLDQAVLNVQKYAGFMVTVYWQ